MAKKSMIARDVKRKKLVERYAAKRKSLIDAFKSAKDPMERLEIIEKYKLCLEIVHQIELEIVVGRQESQEEFIEILDFAETNLDQELITENCPE